MLTMKPVSSLLANMVALCLLMIKRQQTAYIPGLGFFVASDDGDDANVYIEWEQARANTTRLYKVSCYDDDGVGEYCVYNGRSSPDLYCLESTAFQVPSPKDANIVVSCTSVNNTAEQDLTLVFAQ